jgi:hypothetical protein
MTLDKILHSAIASINQSDSPLDLGIDRVNLYLSLVNLDYFKLWCGLPEEWQPGQPITRRGWQVAEKNSEALKPFLVETQNYVVDVDGKLSYPNNFVKLSDIGYFNSITSRYRPIEEVSHQEKYERLGDPIVAPELEYPIVIYENTFFQFYPIDLLNVEMSYFRLPVTPVYAIKQENGIDVYDSATSVQFEWAEQYHNDLIRLLIGYLAPASKDSNLTQLAELKKQQGI